VDAKSRQYLTWLMISSYPYFIGCFDEPGWDRTMLVGELLRGDGKRNTIGRLNALRAGNSIGRPA